MARLLALNAIFFMVPFAVYAGWLFATRRTLGTESDWSTRVIVILCSIGALFVVIGLVVLTASEGTSTSQTYIPADIQDGQIVPGRFVDD